MLPKKISESPTDDRPSWKRRCLKFFHIKQIKAVLIIFPTNAVQVPNSGILFVHLMIKLFEELFTEFSILQLDNILVNKKI